MRRLAWFSVIALLGFAGCNSTTPERGATTGGTGTAPTGEAPRVGGAEAHKLVQSGAVLLDVRSEEEFADGHIEGARNLPLNRLRAEMSSLPKDKPIVVYCAVGARSAQAAHALHTAGYDVRNLGPMATWDR